MLDERARLTIVDVLYVVFALGALAALYPVLSDALSEHAVGMSSGELYIFQLVLPVAILVLFSMIYVKTVGGVGR